MNTDYKELGLPTDADLLEQCHPYNMTGIKWMREIAAERILEIKKQYIENIPPMYIKWLMIESENKPSWVEYATKYLKYSVKPH